MYLDCELEWNCLVSLQVNDMDVADILEAMGVFRLLGLPCCRIRDEGGENPEERREVTEVEGESS